MIDHRYPFRLILHWKHAPLFRLILYWKRLLLDLGDTDECEDARD